MLIGISAALAARPPGPPGDGPGAPIYAHDVAVTRHGRGGERLWLYTPVDPVPPEAPVVVYLHGFGRRRPERYHPLLVHLARRGYAVVFPAQGGPLSVRRYPDHTRVAVASALQVLSSPDHPDPGALALVGHSLGGLLALELAAAPQRAPALPEPAAVILHDPAGTRFVDWHEAASELVDPLALLVLTVPATLASDNGATRPVWAETQALQRRALLAIRSDLHGSPPLISDHLGVQSGDALLGPDRPLDAIDWWGYWRPTEAALQETLLHQIPAMGSVFCACDGVLDRGRWSDGTPVIPLEPVQPDPPGALDSTPSAPLR
ncbi:MAG TPA: alpha/beta fold hydrolase [Deltaproteobacteria bacterium]|nr:alpha/beta fold hydrolase [Deltaproteobacteria bacterium]